MVWQLVVRDSSAKWQLVLERHTKLQKYWLSVKPEPGKEFIDIVFVEEIQELQGNEYEIEMVQALSVSGKKIWRTGSNLRM